MLQIKRVYEKPERGDGERILVDRLWPRGLNKEKAKIDQWLKDLGPSTELRKWFGHDPERWEEFKKKYWQELSDKKEMLDMIRQKLRQGKVTLLYGAKDTEHNQAVVLQEYLAKK